MLSDPIRSDPIRSDSDQIRIVTERNVSNILLKRFKKKKRRLNLPSKLSRNLQKEKKRNVSNVSL